MLLAFHGKFSVGWRHKYLARLLQWLLKPVMGNPWHFGADPDLSFYSEFMDAKKFFFIFFSSNLPAGSLSSVLKFSFLLKFCVNIFFCNLYFSPLSTYMRKGKDPDLYLTNGSGSGRPKNMRIRILNTDRNYNFHFFRPEVWRSPCTALTAPPRFSRSLSSSRRGRSSMPPGALSYTYTVIRLVAI